MKRNITALFLFTSVFFLMQINLSAAVTTSAEETPKDSLPKKEKVFKNTIRYNFTNTILFGTKTLILGYERTIGKHQSASLNIGTLSLPKFSFPSFNLGDSLVTGSRSSTEKGYSVSVDYRFYLRHENRYNSPRGVYLAPYYNYNFFERKNTLTLNSNSFKGEAITTFDITMHGAGCELGYQFILWKRFSMDFVLIGPGLTNYSVNASIGANLSPEEKSALLKKINDALASKIPGYSLVIDDLEFAKSGNVNTTTFGFRYMLNLGFRF